MELLTIVWDFDPVLINIFGFEIRWYSLMWVLALLAATPILISAKTAETPVTSFSLSSPSSFLPSSL